MDFYTMKDAIHGIYYTDGNIKTFMSPDQYSLYDIGGLKTKLYYFNGEKADFIKDEEIIKLHDVIKDIDEFIASEIYCLRAMGKYQFYCLIMQGKNGTGDLVDDDMTNVLGYLNKLKESGATWRCVTDVFIDIPDDLSTWAITFTID